MIDATHRLRVVKPGLCRVLSGVKGRHLMSLAAPVAVAVLIAGCGNSASATSSHATSTTRSSAAASTNGPLTVTATEFAFNPARATARAGKLKLTLVNDGKTAHELIVLKSDRAAGSLSVKSGRVSEAGSVGEVSETAAGATRSSVLTLERGRYVFVCNIPGHYADGMRGTLIVT